MELTTALVIGDPHFKVNNLRETDAMVEAIVQVALDRHPSFIVVLGDILDRHETIHVSPLTRATIFINRLQEIAPTYMLIGNHDLKNNRQFLSTEHPFAALKLWGPNLVVVDIPHTANIGGHRFVFLPYVPPGRFVEALDYVPEWMATTTIFGHQEFRGVRQGAIVSVQGDEWPLTHPYVVTGHIHDYQELQPNILYPGTPIQHSFGDTHEKTISYFTFGSNGVRTHERINLGLPRKQIVRIRTEEVGTYEPVAEGELKILIRGTTLQIKAIMKHPKIKVWEKAGHRVVYKHLSEAADAHPSGTTNLGGEPSPPLRFATVLATAIAADPNPRLQPLFLRIFGGTPKSEIPVGRAHGSFSPNPPPKLLRLLPSSSSESGVMEVNESKSTVI